MNQSAFKQTETRIKKAAELVAEKSMVQAATEAKKHYYENDDGMVDIAVSGDGTWRKRGYTSLYGVVAALSVVTGKVLDVEVLSKSAGFVQVTKQKWEQQNMICGGMYISMSARQIFLVLLVQWMLLVVSQNSTDQ